ncbi:peptidase [Streptomyces sp. NPDC001770]
MPPKPPARLRLPARPLSPARLRDGRALTSLGLAAGIAVPGVLLGGPPTSVAEHSATATVLAEQPPACGDPEAKDFPIDTRIHGGPDTYASGGGYGIWYLDLVNTTAKSCRALHPVLVLTDQDRQLTPDQIQLAYAERAGTEAGPEHRVSWETTDRNEQIGVFGSGEGGDDFEGFTVPAGRTVTVRVRMAFTSDTRPGKVVANAAIVQRRPAASPGDAVAEGSVADGSVVAPDGDWVGESEDYPFSIVEGDMEGGADLVFSDESASDEFLAGADADAGDESGTGADAGDEPGTGAEAGATEGDGGGDADAESGEGAGGGGATGTDGGAATDGGTGAGTGPGGANAATPGTRTGTSPPAAVPRTTPSTAPPGGSGLLRDAAGNPLPELARTGRPGRAAAPRTGAVAAALLLAGTAALLLARRMRRGRG